MFDSSFLDFLTSVRDSSESDTEEFQKGRGRGKGREEKRREEKKEKRKEREKKPNPNTVKWGVGRVVFYLYKDAQGLLFASHSCKQGTKIEQKPQELGSAQTFPSTGCFAVESA